MPGISKLGIIMTAFKILGFGGYDAYLISNLMGIHDLIKSIIFYLFYGLYYGIFQTKDLLNIVLSIIFSFIFTYISLIVGSKYIENKLFINLIVIYRILMSVLIFFF